MPGRRICTFRTVVAGVLVLCAALPGCGLGRQLKQGAFDRASSNLRAPIDSVLPTSFEFVKYPPQPAENWTYCQDGSGRQTDERQPSYVYQFPIALLRPVPNEATFADLGTAFVGSVQESWEEEGLQVHRNDRPEVVEVVGSGKGLSMYATVDFRQGLVSIGGNGPCD